MAEKDNSTCSDEEGDQDNEKQESQKIKIILFLKSIMES